VPRDKQLEEVPYDGDVKRGDLGVLYMINTPNDGPIVDNHHFIVTDDVSGESFNTIEGNLANPLQNQGSPWNSVIAERNRSRNEVKRSGGSFYRPIWVNLL
jgi:hypothetical protein